jgi:hypothetical protein
MARVKKQLIALGQVTVTTTPTTIADLLGLDITDDSACMFPGVIIQADPANGDEIYLGGVDANGVPDVAQAKSIKLVANGGFAFEADMSGGDEDLELYDLREMSLRAGSSLLANISVVKIGQVKYNS